MQSLSHISLMITEPTLLHFLLPRLPNQPTLQSHTGKYRGLQGNPCNENRIPAMRTGFPVMKTGFSL